MRTKRDQLLIHQFEHDEASNAKRVKITDTEMNMELNHADGDSVTSHPAKLSASAIGVDANDASTVVIPAMDCSSLRSLSVVIDGTGDLEIEISMSDTADHWKLLGNQNGSPHEITARRVRIKSVNVVGDIHLCGRS